MATTADDAGTRPALLGGPGVPAALRTGDVADGNAPRPDRPHALVLMSDAAFGELFDPPRVERLRRGVSLPVDFLSLDVSSPAARDRLARTEVLITGWGSPTITAAVLDAAPALSTVFFTGGSVKAHISPACWSRGLVVTSAADANAIPVAEFTVGTILLEGKRARTYAAGYRAHRDISGDWRASVPPTINNGGVVSLVGLSRVGRRVAALLRPFDLTVLAVDPYASRAEAASLGARLVGLDEALRCGDIVSLHAPSLPATRHLIDADRLALMRDGAVLINTARGTLVDTAALIEHCRSGRIRAVLDVTDPEELPTDSALFELPSVELTPHIAGSMQAEAHRLADSALEELERFRRGEPLRHAVDPRTLERSA
ncbi:hydroxyacid dehydrogenase [Occultella glacieicola]|uniref:Hydroxyacid dehydrogenase n=1 Tax=Occultella glacieicola TaxID=2518684 RepID=A0ABY2E4K5_9MICO|nr:hydroxyacid dehydrogenase [Occultella glacieicola]TDE90341.1 hydroxyacid dehydrogenase [Occultella glacieicola]